MSPSAPTKDCPQCLSALPLKNTQCHCGHLFAVTDDIDMTLATQAEVLYETHLRARLQRATRLTRAAKVDLLRDPTNVAKKARLREMENELLLLENQIDLQGSRIADARAATLRSLGDNGVTALDAFRAAQHTKAERSIELNRLQAALDESCATQVTGAFSAAQAKRAYDVVQETPGPQACPNCNAAMNSGTIGCTCGYQCGGSQDDKELTNAAELSVLRGNT